MLLTAVYIYILIHAHAPCGADKSLAQPGKKQATGTKLGIYLTLSVPN